MSADARLTRAAVTAFANWLGLFRQQANLRPVPSSSPWILRAGLRLTSSARQDDRGRALAVVRSNGVNAQGPEVRDLAQVRESQSRGSDTVGVVARAAAVLLRGRRAEMTETIADRLMRAAYERDIDMRVNVLSLTLSSESSEALVRQALSSTTHGESEEP